MTKKQSSAYAPALVAVGIDVSKNNLMFCKRYADGQRTVFEIRNRQAEIRKVAKGFKKEDYRGKIVIESTGRHHLPAAMEMSGNDLDTRVINPLLSSKYMKSAIRKVKTDKRDAEVLSEIALKEEKLPQPFHGDKEILKMKKKASLISALDKQLQKLSSTLNEFEQMNAEMGMKLSVVEKQIIKTISLLKGQKKDLEKEVEAMSVASKTEIINRYQSIPGVSRYMASLAALFFNEKEHDQSAKQWIAFAGLDISVRESGNWRGKGKLTKRGNGYLRKRLFQAGWGAKQHNEQFRKYYEQLRARGKSYIESLIIIARKIVAIMFTLAKNDCRYDDTKTLFATS